MFDLILASNTGVMLTRTEKFAKARAATASSTSSTSCCTMCPGATVAITKRFANNSSNFKWNGNGNQQGHGKMSINLLSPNQAMLAMHRKCKSKSKSKTKITSGSGLPVSVVSASPPSSSALQQIKHHLGTFPTANTLQSKPSSHQKLIHSTSSLKSTAISRVMTSSNIYDNITMSNQVLGGKAKKKISSSRLCSMLRCPLPTLGATSFITLLTVICIETVLLSNMSSCAKTFYMHWNTSNSIFRIDNTDHIIDVNKGNLAFEFDQVHIICPVYEPGAFDNETEKYIIYNVSKVEYETCRITNADPRVIAICDKPQKLMFFTITFRPFTPQPGGLEFLPGNDYYFISTSSKDDLYRRIGGRCSTNNMKVVFKVCCALEEKNRTTPESTLVGSVSGERDNSGSTGNRMENSGVDIDINRNVNANINAHGHGHNSVNTIGISGVNTGFIPAGSGGASSGNKAGQLMPVNGMGTSINTNIDQFNRIPLQPNIVGNNIGAAGSGIGNGNSPGSSGGIILSPGHGSINMLPPGRGSVGIHMPYPGHHHIQTGIRINNVPTQQNNNQHPHYKGNGNANNNNNNGKDILKNQSEDSQYYLHEVGKDNGNAILTNIGRYLPPVVDTNHSNIVQSTINWLLPAWGSDSGSGADISTSSSKTNITLNSLNNSTTRLNNNYTPTTSHSPPDHGNEIKKNEHHNYDKHPNEVVKNEELTYNSGSGQEARNHLLVYVWIFIWLGSMCGIEPTVLIALSVVNIIHKAIGICTTGTSHHRSLETRDTLLNDI